tara:strand:+ start:335 stop:592 length:258 start_codon:yes stop_codon:yes gene_type:complete
MRPIGDVASFHIIDFSPLGLSNPTLKVSSVSAVPVVPLIVIAFEDTVELKVADVGVHLVTSMSVEFPVATRKASMLLAEADEVDD